MRASLVSASWILALFLAVPSPAVSEPGLTSALAAEPIRRILALGDSLTEGYGIAPEDAYPEVLERLLKQGGQASIEVINAGISGSTSASAVGRLKWHLRAKPDLVILALGANDGLRGLNLDETRKNLAATIELAKKNGIQVLLAGMQIPPNYGKEYTRKFEAMFPSLAAEYRVPLIPFLLQGVGGEPKLNLEDGIHPNEKGHQRLARNVLQSLTPLLKGTGK